MLDEHYEIIIVGSGPAGLGVASVIKDNTSLAQKTLIIEKGKSIEERRCYVREGELCRLCNPCNVISGLGGAGPYTDGKICLFRSNLESLLPEHERSDYDEENNKIVDDYLNKVKEIWTTYSYDDVKIIKPQKEMVNSLKIKANKENIKFNEYPVIHISTDNASITLNNFIKDLENCGIKIKSESNVVNIKKLNDKYYLVIKYMKNSKYFKHEITCKYLVLALGRDFQRSSNIHHLFNNINVKFIPDNLEIGVRIEVSNHIMDDIIETTYDPKFKIKTPTYDDEVRTFCVCHKGKIVREGQYVNGHTDRKSLTENTNFALIVRWPLQDLFWEDAMDYGYNIAKILLAQGKGKPIIQLLGDLKKGKTSTLESISNNYIKPTLNCDLNVIPGNINNSYPRRLIIDILEGLEELDKVITGVNKDYNLIYAPEIKPSCVVNLIKGVKTDVPNLYVCGDFSGHTRGISQAMAMGIMVGKDILNK